MFKLLAPFAALMITSGIAESRDGQPPLSGNGFKVCEHVHSGTSQPYAVVPNNDTCPVYQHPKIINGQVYNETHAPGASPVFQPKIDELDPTNRDCYLKEEPASY